jgi:hypothetical protein
VLTKFDCWQHGQTEKTSAKYVKKISHRYANGQGSKSHVLKKRFLIG